MLHMKAVSAWGAGLLLALSTGASADIFELSSTIDGSQQVPPNGSKAVGDATMTYDDDTNMFLLDVVVSGLTLNDISGTHIHLAPSGENGSVIVNLLLSHDWEQDGDNIRLTIPDGSLGEQHELALLTEGTYINIHTNAFPAGEIRGQILLGGGGGECEGPAFAGAINEIRIDMSGSDNDEYFELAGEAGSCLNDVFYIVIGDGDGGSGTIECIIDLTGIAIADDGLLLVTEETFTLNGVTPDVIFNSNTLNFENSDNVTHMLVHGLNPAMHLGGGFGGSDLDVDDDGEIDPTGDYDGDAVDDGPPWTDVIDSVSLVEDLKGGDLFYGEVVVGPDGTFVPAQVFRCPDEVGDWVIGSFSFEDMTDTPSDPNDCPAGFVVDFVDLEITFGSLDSGDLNSITMEDGDSLNLRSQVGFSALERNLTEAAITGMVSAGFGQPSTIDISTVDQSDTTLVVAKIRMLNSAGGLDDICEYSVSFQNDESHGCATGLDAAEYIDGNNEMQINVKYVAPATFTPLGFLGKLNLLQVDVQ